ncbi:unnamed protein product [Bursaphelenchus xylophilus]|uniref:(pine wood nematode) hypothetical protein n=1 Tax=Bursaphelenchus xylophilus TaxID=6326 RepID=A0A1I7RRG0_BURXY|nr:unnamed protein product [Bursaphelenchus xylophilus]CAG9131012.1 unnamed protein product [Bursaphelenchus xylophilus]
MAEQPQVPSNPRYNQKQLSRALGQIQKRKSARAEAKEEEKEYVEYKKAMVLASCQPTVGTLKSTEDKFPARPKKKMQFGERKAHYLSIRPNPKYATWVGRKKGIIEAKARVATTTNVQFTDHSSVPTPTTSSAKSSDSKAKGKAKAPKKKDGGESNNSHIKTEEKDPKAVESPIGDDEVERKGGKNAENPLVNGVPFWTNATPGEQDELTDDDLPIDMSLLEKVCNYEVVLAGQPFTKTMFNPFGPMARFKQDDPLFVRDTTLFASTVEAVISLQPDDKQYPPAPPIVPKIKWSDKLTVIVFDPLDREAGNADPINEPLKDIKREKGAKS